MMQEGFFTNDEVKSKTRPNGKTYSCASCGLSKACKSPHMLPFGKFKKGILNIGEVPSEIDDIRGKQWQGKHGQLLQRTYAELGIDLFEDCLNINAVNCRTEDRLPSDYEVECCRKSVFEIIDKYQPNIIVLFGTIPLYSILGHRWKKSLDSIFKWRGYTIPDQELNAWVCPTLHPSIVSHGDEEVMTIWKQDLAEIISKINIPIPKYKEPKIKVISDLSELANIKSDLIAFDYETTGLKPHAKGHRIVCASVATSPNYCYVFMMPTSKKERQPFVDLLLNPDIGKMAHNMKFENTWSKVRLKAEVQNWQWDSMLAAHIFDNRPGITGLKFQACVNFGVLDYSSELEPYLDSDEKEGSNTLNKIFDLVATKEGTEKLLHYCALDSIYEYRLAMMQTKQIDFSFLPF